MKTDQLIAQLAQGAGPTSAEGLRCLLPGMCLGLGLAAVLMCSLVGPLPASSFLTPLPWIKLLPTALLLGLAWAWAQRSARPASRVAPLRLGVMVSWGLLMAAGLLTLVGLSSEARMEAMMGNTWYLCPNVLAALSIPVLLLMLRAARGLPTSRPRQMGAAFGLLAGCVASTAYSLVCTEASPAFVALWYSTGLLLSTLLGALLGPRWLGRW
jgi:hypothetical protein